MKRHEKIRKVWIIVGILIALFGLSVPVSAIMPEWSTPQTIVSPQDDSWGWDEHLAYSGPGQWHVVWTNSGNRYKPLSNLKYIDSAGVTKTLASDTMHVVGDTPSGPYYGGPNIVGSDIASDANGNLGVIYQEKIEEERKAYLYYISYINGIWSDPVRIYDYGECDYLFDSPQLAFSAPGEWHVVDTKATFNEGGMGTIRKYELIYVNSTGYNTTLATAQGDVNDGGDGTYISGAKIASDSDGNLGIVYIDGIVWGESSYKYISYINGILSDPEPIIGTPMKEYDFAFSAPGKWHMVRMEGSWEVGNLKYLNSSGFEGTLVTVKQRFQSSGYGEGYWKGHQLVNVAIASDSNGNLGVIYKDSEKINRDLEMYSLKYMVNTFVPLDANFEGTPTTGVTPLKVEFEDTSTGNGITLSEWQYKLNSDSTWTNLPLDEDSSFTFTDAGSYDINITVTGTYGTDYEMKANYLNIQEGPPVAAFDASPLQGDTPLKVTFTDKSKGNEITSRVWEYKLNTDNTWKIFSLDGDASFSFTDVGTYDIKLTVTGQGGSDDETKTDYITVQEGPLVADFSANPLSGSAPLKVTFSDISKGHEITSRVWEYKLNTENTWKTFALDGDSSYTFTDLGTYDVQLTITGQDSSDTKTRNGYIAVGTSSTTGKVSFDEERYTQFTGAKKVIVNDPDMNIDPFGEDSLKINILSILDGEIIGQENGYELTLIETGFNTGIFEAEFYCTNVAPGGGKYIYVDTAHQGVFHALYIDPVDANGNKDQPQSADAIYDFGLEVTIERDQSYWELTYPLNYHSPLYDHTWSESGAKIPITISVSQDNSPIEGANIYFSDRGDYVQGVTDWRGKYSYSYGMDLDERTERTFTVTAKTIDRQGITDPFNMYKRSIVDGPVSFKVSGMDDFIVDFHRAGSNLWQGFDVTQHPVIASWNIVSTLIGFSNNLVLKIVSNIGNTITTYEVTNLFYNDIDFTKDPTVIVTLYRYDWKDPDGVINKDHPLYLLEILLQQNGATTRTTEYWFIDGQFPIPNIQHKHDMLMMIQSPVVLWITAPDGTHAGYDPVSNTPVNEFPSAFSNKGDEPFYFYVPQLSPGEYHIDIIGTESGSYTLTITDIDPAGTKKDITTITGQTTAGKIESFIVTVPESGDIVVLPANQPPDLQNPSDQIITEGNSLTINLVATDSDNDPLTYSFTTPDTLTGASISGNIFTWTPGSGTAGKYPVTFNVSDTGGLFDEESINITVEAPIQNTKPDLTNPGDKSVNEGSELQITLEASDPENDPLTYTFKSTKTLPGASIIGDVFAWTPGSGIAGTYPVTFNVTDKGGLSDEESINITVNASITNVPTNVKIVPKTINLGSKGYFLAFVTLPEAYKSATIDMKTVSCEGAPGVRMMRLKLLPRVVGFVFKTSDLQGVEVGKKVTLNIKGELKNKGTTYTFTGTDSVKVISKPTWQPDDIKDISKESDDQLFKKFNT